MSKLFLIIIVLSLSFLFGFGCISCDAAEKPVCKYNASPITSRPNIILITINSLRADHVGAYGYMRKTTPHFDQFAKENVFFSTAFSTSSWQMPSHGSILTSLYPSEHGAVHINNKLTDKCKTLPEIIAKEGYYTVGFCSNPRLSSEKGFARGFDFYDDYSVEMFLENISMSGDEKININQQRTNDLINQSAIRWLENNKAAPFFLYLHYYDNHWDYLPPEPYYSMFDPDYKGEIDGKLISKEPLYSNPPSEGDIEHIKALYDGEVRQTDEDLGVFLRYLGKNGLMENSVIVITGEHGEQLYEHGNTSHHGLYDEMIRIPMAMHLPGRGPEKNESLVSLVDILPTILDIIDLNNMKPVGSKGLSLLRANDKIKSRSWVYAEYTGGAIPNCSALRSKRYKVLQSEDVIKVYDLLEDPQELRPLRKSQFDIHVNNLIKSLGDINKISNPKSSASKNQK